MSAASAQARRADSYYGRPILKEPVWKPEIPWYFFTGGLGGRLVAARAGGAAARATSGWRATPALIARPREAVKPAAPDRGPRPARALPNMLRVFKVTSPMSVGVVGARREQCERRHGGDLPGRTHRSPRANRR